MMIIKRLLIMWLALLVCISFGGKTFHRECGARVSDTRDSSLQDQGSVPRVMAMEEDAGPIEVDVNQAFEMLKDGAALLDVREPQELQICKIEGSLDIPMRQVPMQLSQLPKSRCLLVLCHHGSRSAHVTHFLRNQGFNNAVNVAGGIDAWAYQIDPQLDRY